MTDPKIPTLEVWSCGGGTQSAAIAALIVTGKLPKPDLAVIVDTEREKETTWRYYTNVLRPELWKLGVMLHRSCKPLEQVDLTEKQHTLGFAPECKGMCGV